MFGSDVIEVAIGMSLLFLFVSLICSALREGLEGILKTRAKTLERAIREMLDDRTGTTITKKLFDHPLIYSLFPGEYDPSHLTGKANQKYMPFLQRRNLPSYIPAANFAGAFLDFWARGAIGKGVSRSNKLSPDHLRRSIADLPNDKLRRAALYALDLAQDDIEAAKKNIETWFNATMDRVTGWYKRRTQLVLFVIGLLAAASLNIDAIAVAQRLMRDKPLRAAVVAQSDAIVRGSDRNADLTALSNKNLDQLKSNLDSIGYPMGWKDFRPAPQFDKCPADKGQCLLTGLVLQIALGWLITALAVTLGAPFWFDVLNKFMLLRSTVRPQDVKGQGRSVDGPPSPAASNGRSKPTDKEAARRK
jgi:hypothetical protein